MNVAIVVAGGQGTRFGGNRPKQFLELGGTPVIIHTLRQFEQCGEISQVIAVLPVGERDHFQSLIEQSVIRKVSRIVDGGETRAQSVQNGLAAITEAELVAVHDGVRPFVTPDEIDQVVRAAEATGAAIAVAPVSDTIKTVTEGRVMATLPRSELRRALTPQCFRFDLLKRAYRQLAELETSGVEVTDDSFLIERLGVEIVAVESSARNIKITRAEDLVMAEAILGGQ
jgi:2-C-methyl-D-erythritol 4-phosphate cytidylyltransferase